MLNFFSNFFSQSKNDLNEEQKYLLDISNENSVSIVLDNHDKPIIRLNIQKTDKESCKKTAEFLYLMNKGVYQLQIIDMLKEIALQEDSKYTAIENILKYWGEYLDVYDTSSHNNPCVSPLTFSKMVAKKEIYDND